MSVSNQTNKTYGSGDGVTVTFSYPFKVFDVSELYVYKIAANGTVTGPLTYTTDFTATISSVTEGGTITFVAAPASGTTWFLKRIVPYTQSAVIPSEGTFPGKQFENQLDLITMMVIQANETISRALVMPTTFIGTLAELPTPQDGYAIGWSGTSGGLQNLPSNAAAINSALITAAASASSASTQATASAASAVAAAASAAAAAVSANPSYVKCSNTQAQNTAGGSTSLGAWRTIPLNTKDTDSGSIASLSANQIVLPAGTYIVFAQCPFYATVAFQTRLENITDSSLILTGTSGISNVSTVNTMSVLHGRFTLATSKTLEFQYQTSGNEATDGLGKAANMGVEVYATIEFTKVA